MQVPLFPDEFSRLEALRHSEIFDTAPEPRFDDLAHLAAQICGAPISAITLINQNGQWFKSRIGANASEILRDVSFCDRALREREILLVPDTRDDERFASSPLVAPEPHVRFYAGVPLLTPEEQPLGTLCVVDVVPRELDEAQQDALRRLARQAVVLLEARTQQARQRLSQQQLPPFNAEVVKAAQRDANALKTSETRYRRLFEAAKDGILILDAKSGEIEDVNPYLCSLLGYERDDFLGKHLWEIGAFRDVAASQDAFHILQKEEYIRYDDLPFQTKAGPSTSVEFISNVYFCGPKKVIQCNIRDISERKRAAATQARLVAILEATPDFVCIANTSQHPVYLNRAARSMLGIGPEEDVSDLVLDDICAPATRIALQEGIALAIAGGVWSGETALLGRSGLEIPISKVILAHKSDDGNLEFLSTVARDISDSRRIKKELLEAKDELEAHVRERTAELGEAIRQLHAQLGERQRTEESLREAQQRLQLVMNHIPQAIFWKDRECIYLGCNGRLAADAGLDSPDEVKGKSDFDMPWAQYAAGYQHDDKLAMETNSPRINIEQALLKGNQETVWLRTNKIPLHDGAGQVIGVLGSYEDISEQKRAEASVHDARREADAANLAKSEFLSRMSHELRTPLNAILGFGQILESRTLDPLSLESVGYILQGGRHLLDLINEVLDISRVEAGHLDLFLETLTLDEIVTEACALVRPLAAERSIRLETHFPPAGCPHVLANRQRLKQVLINLLANAIKYNREGGQVDVSCRLTPDGQAVIAVRDTGPGLSSQDLSKLFIPFERLSATNSEVEGTGLGLVFSQRLVTAMNGTLEVESILGRGSTFTVELPQAEAPEDPLESPHDQNVVAHSQHQNPDPKGVYSVLCIEDNPSNLRLIEAIFEIRPEISLLAAMQGGLGLELARQHQPDLILLDLNLPDLGGKEVLIQLQQSDLTRAIPVVIISADATSSQIEELLSAGARAYLTKPLDVAEFLHTLDTLLPEKLNPNLATAKPNSAEA